MVGSRHIDLGRSALNVMGLLICYFYLLPLAAQNQTPRFDELLSDWKSTHGPGGILGVMEAGEIIYLEAFGQSNLEYKTPIDRNTLFNIGSVSKQFTAMGILLLEEQGLLNLDDTIDQYLSGLPEFASTITINHLIHHTSGLRSLHDIVFLAGWRGDDYRTNEDLLRILRRQKDLNFSPGERFSYCNSGYVLLAEIIQSITGMDFKDWMKQKVFEPLGMYATFVEDNYQTVTQNKSTSYYHSHDAVYETAQGYWAYTGASNVYATVEDLLVWSKNFYHPPQDWSQRFERMLTLQPLSDGTPNSYAFGLFLDEKYNRNRIQHSGVVGGFRSFLCIYPEEGVNIVVLANASNAPFGETADKAAQIVLETWTVGSDNSELKSDAVKPVDDKLRPTKMEAYSGTYYSPELETVYQIEQIDGKLVWRQIRHGELELTYNHGDTFTSQWPVEKLEFSQDEHGKVNGMYISNAGVVRLWCRKIDVNK